MKPPSIWKVMARGVLLGVVLLVCTVASAWADPPDAIDIDVKPVALDLDDLTKLRAGKLIYRGGFAMTARDSRFGGWSGVRVNADGTRLTAVTDRGAWLEARLVHDDSGQLIGITDTRLGDLVDLAGRKIRWPLTDSEGLARLSDGSFLVSFERRHRIWLYPQADPPFSRPPRALPSPPGLERAPANGGIETIVALQGGRILAIAEDLYEDGDNVAWLGDGRGWQRLRYRAGLNFQPTDAVQMANGDILVLERRFSMLGVPGGRVVRVARDSVRADAVISGEELAVLEPPLVIDNFEGIATAEGKRGDTLIYIMSDDNFSFLQRNLLLMFELPR